MGLYPKIETSHLAGQLRGIASKNWYVHGADGDDSSPGDRPEKPLATLQEALDRTTAAAYDSIFITRGVVTGEVTPFLLDKANVRIIGDPYAVDAQSTNCAVIATGDTDCFTFQASDISIEGLTLYAGATSHGVGFATLEWSQRNVINKCMFYLGTWGVYTGGVHTPDHHLSITNCMFLDGLTVGGIYYASNGSWNLFKDNFFDHVPQGIIVISAGGTAAGRIIGNIFSLPTGFGPGEAIAMMGASSRYYITDNQAIDAGIDANSGGSPFGDNNTTNMWGRNFDGSHEAEAPIAL